jgi:type II secretory pathway predicted ATPase ExeA/Tfp pilus assembly protein PilF
MYDSFYNLSEKPFGISADPRFLWGSETHNEALANLEYGVMERNGFVVLTGDIGTGKTTLVNALLDMLSDDVLIAKINHPSLDTTEFLTLVAKTFDPSAVVSGPSDLLIFFGSFLKKVHNDGKIALLIVDEAHRLSKEVLEEIRLLSNIEQDGTRLLNVIFIGQKELKPILASPSSRALQQRITLYYEIQLLSQAETAMYVSHRLNVCGRKGQLFTPSALQKIYTFSRGNPRLINILCNRALLTGYVKNRRTIDADIIKECTREISSWYDSKSRVSVKTFQRISAGVHAHLKALRAPSAAAQFLNRSLKQLGKTKEETTKGMLFIYGALTEKVTAVARGLSGKYRRHWIQVALLAGLTSIVLVLTFGLLKGTDSGDPRSPQSQREVSTAGPTSNVSWSHEENKTKPVEMKTAASVETVGKQSAGQAKAPDTKTSDPAPLPEHEAAPLMAAHEQLDPVELSKAALEQKDYQKALMLLEARQDSRKGMDSSSSALYAKALVGRAGEILASAPREAEGMLWKAVELAPDNAKTYVLLGKHYTKIKAYPRAIDAYRKAVHLDPLIPDAFFNLGYIYATISNYEAAEQAFSRAVQLKPPYLDKSLYNLAVVQQKLGKKAESLSNLEQAVTLAPENEKALAYLSRLKRAEAKNTPVRTR